jgi:hypothetical protein
MSKQKKNNTQKDTQSRKYQLTINNPDEHGLSHEQIFEKLEKHKTIYCCMSDEIGLKDQTKHMHVFVIFSSPVRFSTMKKEFPTEVHFEESKGTNKENRDYIIKGGKWENDEKHETKIEGTFEERGEMPIDRSRSGDKYDEEFVRRVQEGATNAELINEYPKYWRDLHNVDKLRYTFKNEEMGKKNRDVVVTYVWGATRTGKTTHVLETISDFEAYRVTDYKNPFDGYKGEDVLILDEFASSIKINTMNNLIDKFPLELPCRYSNKQALFTHVYIISNLKLEDQYIDDKFCNPDIYAAFLKRIHQVMYFYDLGKYEECNAEDYFTGNSILAKILPNDTPTP